MDIRELLYDFAKGDVLRILRKGTAQKIYVEARMGVGATALLQEVAEAAEIRRAFDVVIKVVRPAPFGNLREMQRAVAEQLNHLLPPSVVTTAAAFDAADEDDDFSGVEFSSRGQLPEVRKQIYQAVKDRSSVLLVLCNSIAGGKLIDPNELGKPRQRVRIGSHGLSHRSKLPHLILCTRRPSRLPVTLTRAAGALADHPASSPPLLLYCLLLLRRAAFNQSVLMPDGDPSWKLLPSILELGKDLTSIITITEEEEKDSSYRWISLCSPIPEPWDFFFKEYRRSVLSEVSSFFGHFEETHQALPDGFFDHFSNVRVLDLLGCIVSPINPSFLRLRNLRMLRLERCKVTSLDHPNSHPSATATEGGRWESLPLYGLQVLNLYSSDADKILLAGKTFELMPNLLELDLTENISTEFLSRSLSMAIKLKVLILTNCKGLEYLNFSLPATIETISLQRCGSLKEVELLDPAAAPLPNLTTFRLSGSTLIAKLSLQGCRKLENVDLQELTGSRCKQLRRVVCLHETQKLDVLYLDNYSGSSTCNVDVDRCLDSFRNQTQSELTKETNDADQRLLFHAHVVVRDVRLFRSLRYAFSNPIYKGSCFHIHVKRSSTAKRGTNIGTTTRSNAIIMSALCYADVLNTMTDRHRRHHPSPPAMPLKNHIEVDGGHDSRIAEEDISNVSALRGALIWSLSSLIGVKLSIWRAYGSANFRGSKALCEEGWIDALLKHIYLEFCARLEYVVPSLYLLYNLETINIRYCGNLTAIFISRDDHKKDKRGAAPLLLPKLRSIHLQELPKLQHIYEPNICAPSLEEIKIMGCFNLKKLPLFGHLDARSMRAMEISCEKDWWDKLQWDGLESNHHSFLFNPKHCPYHKKRMKARWF
uniref:Disease resistance protein At4g27190-like leucine-rich repeats domain-containing protein n=1 Tax=Ananas comosus var. bracteatus TaxID=296719 RepID=A0A6V7NI59_ANACO|nr:unnamed protein product [Ananas comosus var. bracteatus]